MHTASLDFRELTPANNKSRAWSRRLKFNFRGPKSLHELAGVHRLPQQQIQGMSMKRCNVMMPSAPVRSMS
ncbi:hypothetical protein PM082_012295 [Marasmius tenuissimus]|nr:hypothetical protein PM082_012295 [Marasmius tenuissimus]